MEQGWRESRNLLPKVLGAEPSPSLQQGSGHTYFFSPCPFLSDIYVKSPFLKKEKNLLQTNKQKSPSPNQAAGSY